MTERRFLVLPPREIFSSACDESPGSSRYSLRNYYDRTPIGWARRRRLERSLHLALGSNRFGRKCIDMGCADGILLPTLSKHFDEVVGVDRSRRSVDISTSIVNRLGLKNVSLFCNRELSTEEIRRRIGDGFKIMFLLETLEHVGDQPHRWEKMMAFLHECFSLLEPDGRIVISVPKMVGAVVIFKELLQRFTGRLDRPPLTFRQLLRSGFLRNTDELEVCWRGHVGFNHLRLDGYLADHFNVVHRSESLISVFCVIDRRTSRRN